MPLSLITHTDGHHRCSWCNQGEAFADYIRYYDGEWGQPVADERRLFEKITPERVSALTQTAESLALSKALKKLGFSFVGPTTIYAFMESMGVVNDHLHGCQAQPRVEAARKAFLRP